MSEPEQNQSSTPPPDGERERAPIAQEMEAAKGGTSLARGIANCVAVVTSGATLAPAGISYVFGGLKSVQTAFDHLVPVFWVTYR